MYVRARVETYLCVCTCAYVLVCARVHTYLYVSMCVPVRTLRVQLKATWCQSLPRPYHVRCSLTGHVTATDARRQKAELGPVDTEGGSRHRAGHRVDRQINQDRGTLCFHCATWMQRCRKAAITPCFALLPCKHLVFSSRHAMHSDRLSVCTCSRLTAVSALNADVPILSTG